MADGAVSSTLLDGLIRLQDVGAELIELAAEARLEGVDHVIRAGDREDQEGDEVDRDAGDDAELDAIHDLRDNIRDALDRWERVRDELVSCVAEETEAIDAAVSPGTAQKVLSTIALADKPLAHLWCARRKRPEKESGRRRKHRSPRVDVFLRWASGRYQMVFVEQLALLEQRRVALAAASMAPRGGQKPHYDTDRRELWFQGRLVKRLRQDAENQEKVLEAFQEEEWPPRIDDPLPPGALHETLRRLNKATRAPILRFGADGTGEGIIWSTPGPHGPQERP